VTRSATSKDSRRALARTAGREYASAIPYAVNRTDPIPSSCSPHVEAYSLAASS